MVGVAFRVVVETLAECLKLKRIPADERGFECINGPLDVRVVPTVGSLADTDCAIVGVDLDEDPIAAVVHLNDLGLYVCDF